MDIEYKSRIELLGHTFVVFDLETTGLFFEYFDGVLIIYIFSVF